MINGSRFPSTLSEFRRASRAQGLNEESGDIRERLTNNQNRNGFSSKLKAYFWTGFTGFLVLFKWNGFLFYFPDFPEESLELQSPSANTNLFLHKAIILQISG
jgi:hypothetical protein